MSDDAGTTLGTSEPNPGAPSGAEGSGGDGGTGGSADAGSLAAGDGSAWEARAREWQGKHDRLASELTSIRSELDGLRGQNGGYGNGQPDDQGVYEFDPEAFAQHLEDRFAKRAELREAAGALRGEFGYANDDLFRHAHEFESVDAFKAAVQADHERVEGLVAKTAAEREQALKDQITEKYGVRFDTPTDGGQSPSGDPTPAQINSMSFAEQREFEVANPGVIERVIRQAMATAQR